MLVVLSLHMHAGFQLIFFSVLKLHVESDCRNAE